MPCSRASEVAPLPSHPHPEFVEHLSCAEQAIAAGAINAAFHALVQQLSDMALEPDLARYLEVDRTTRARWDAVWAASDPDALLAEARAKARGLVVEGEALLPAGLESQQDRLRLVELVRGLRALEARFGLDALYGDAPDLGDRHDLLIQAHKEARR
jgi:hypothetical protein